MVDSPFQLLTLGQALRWQYHYPFVAKHCKELRKWWRYYPMIKEWSVWDTLNNVWVDTRGIDPPDWPPW